MKRANSNARPRQVMSGFDLAILGDGDAMPPIKEGGVRTVVLPPALAYGAAGDGCLYGLEGSCRIPPNSEVGAVLLSIFVGAVRRRRLHDQGAAKSRTRGPPACCSRGGGFAQGRRRWRNPAGLLLTASASK